MLRAYFDAGGPVMYAVFGAWVIVFAGVLERVCYVVLRAVRKRRDDEAVRARRGLARIDAVSQLATSIGLFGTVLGIARTFFLRGPGTEGAGPEALSAGLSTALFTTLAGLVVFLGGQAFLIAYGEWLAWNERGLEAEDVAT